MILLLGTALQAAGLPQGKTVELRPLETYPVRQTVGAVTVAAEAYGSDEKCATAFNVKNLTTRGYFPVHVIIQNSSADYVSVSTRKILLDVGSGQGLYTTSAAFAGRKSKDNPGSDAAMIDFTGKELVNKQVEPGATAHGFVFFFTPTPKKDFFAGAKLVIPLLDDATRKQIGPFTLSLAP
jgi:hypothetical protein